MKLTMRTHAIMAVTAVGLLSSPTLGTDTTEELQAEFKANCEAEWPSDYAMQKYCFDRHFTSLQEFLSLIGESPYPKHVKEIGTKCLAEWPGEVVGQDWPMVAYCTRRQLDAYAAIQ